MSKKAVTITAADAEDGDVVRAPDGNVYQYLGDRVWGAIVPVGSYGPPWQPEGELVLLDRRGKPQAAKRAEGSG
jgi:hypothetical protein